MQSQYNAGHQPTKKRRMEDEDNGPSAVRRQMYDHSTVSDNARAHIGNSYNSFYGPVHQVAASIATLENDARNVNLRDALRFEEMDLRRITIKLAHGNTCQWFFDSPEYRKWRDNSFLPEHHGFLWLRGKPGAGKSTLMKHVVRHADVEFPDCLRISFFFNAKGAELEKSIQGMYRSLLCQLLTQSPDLEKLLDQRTWTYKTWPTELLQEIFYDAVLWLGEAKLVCYIDALDECDTSDVRDMIEFLENVASKAVSANVQFRVFFASRHYPHINMPRCIPIILDNLEGHQKDIEAYVENTLKIPRNELRHNLVKEVRTRASDVFLWVILVVRLLNEESDQGKPGRLSDRLRKIPAGLHALFENALLERDTDDTTYLVPILLWVLYGRSAIRPMELYCAVRHAGTSESTAECGLNPSFDEVKKFILNESKGLVEITGTWDFRQVQFIHETVREYLSSGAIGRLDNAFCHNPAGLGHETLRAMCFEYMSHVARSFERLQPFKNPQDAIETYEDFLSRRAQILDKFPFLAEAHRESIYQAELAQIHGVSQNSFLKAFPLELVIRCQNLLELPGYGYSASTSKVFVFAHEGASQLLKLELSDHHGNANHASSADSLTRIINNAGTSFRSFHDRFENPLQIAASRSFECTKILLEHGANVNAKGGNLHTALHAAAGVGNLKIIRLLLEHGADVNARGGHDRYTALHAAVSGHAPDVIKLLVENGADIDAHEIDFEGAHGPTALCEAARLGRIHMVKNLVELGADVNAKWKEGTILRTARKYQFQMPYRDYTQVIAFLLERGARDDDV